MSCGFAAGGAVRARVCLEVFKSTRYRCAFSAGVSSRVAKWKRIMDHDFALIGHQESWRAAADVLAVLRGPQRTPLPDDEIKDILPWIPPRAVCHVELTSTCAGKARGCYIDAF